MSKFTCGLALVALLGLSVLPTAANAEGRIAVYFDPAGTQTSAVSPGAGQIGSLFIYGEGFQSDFISGVQYSVDYGSDLTFLADIGLPPVSIGTSATGISIGFGNNPRPGVKFLVHIAIVIWNNNCEFGSHDITTGPHPGFPDGTPIATAFPGQDVVAADPVTTQTCTFGVEFDIKPGSCPNAFNINRWEFAEGSNPNKGGKFPIAILGSSFVDVTTIDLSTVRLEGVAPLPQGQGLEDLSTYDADNDCICDTYLGPDGYMDQPLKFSGQAIASALGLPEVGDVIELTLTGNYLDGTPFESTDCITIVGNFDGNLRYDLGDGDSDNLEGSAGLGDASPNPFNPVTRISYRVPSTQRVHIAIYDVAGRLVEQLVNETKSAGEYVVEWDAGRLPSGVYFYRMQTGSESFVRRAVLLK